MIRVCADERCATEFVAIDGRQHYCSKGCQRRTYQRGLHQPRRTPAPSGAPRCWAWPAIVEVLDACGEATTAMLAEAVYGDQSEASRRAMAMMLCDLARDRIYPGGPWLARVRWGWYARVEGARRLPSKATVAGALAQRPRTMLDLERLTGVHASVIHRWLAALRREGVLVQRETAPKWRWDRGWCAWYFIGATARKRVAA